MYLDNIHVKYKLNNGEYIAISVYNLINCHNEVVGIRPIGDDGEPMKDKQQDILIQKTEAEELFFIYNDQPVLLSGFESMPFGEIIDKVNSDEIDTSLIPEIASSILGDTKDVVVGARLIDLSKIHTTNKDLVLCVVNEASPVLNHTGRELELIPADEDLRKKYYVNVVDFQILIKQIYDGQIPIMTKVRYDEHMNLGQLKQ